MPLFTFHSDRRKRSPFTGLQNFSPDFPDQAGELGLSHFTIIQSFLQRLYIHEIHPPSCELLDGNQVLRRNHIDPAVIDDNFNRIVYRRQIFLPVRQNKVEDDDPLVAVTKNEASDGGGAKAHDIPHL